MSKYNNSFKYLIPLWCILFVVIYLNFYRYGTLIIDSGREAYYPQEILNGKILYKDLFSIYAPFSYLFNAALFKIFGINLDVLRLAGCFCSFGIITCLFFIAKKFLSEFVSFSLVLLTISVCVLPCGNFNFVYPYSFGLTYGLLSCLISLLFIINYIDKKNELCLYLSCLFAGIAVANKYEFIPYILIYIPVFIRMKSDFLKIFLSIISFFLVPEFCLITLYIQGLNVHDFTNFLSIINKMTHTQTLKYFYMHSGILFHKYTIPFLIFSGIMFILPLFTFFSVEIKHLEKYKLLNILSFSTCLFVLLFIFFKYTPNSFFASIPIILLILFIFNIKKIYSEFSLFILVVTAILTGLKVTNGLLINSYGIFYLPLLLIAIMAIYKSKINEVLSKKLGIYIIVVSLLICCFEIFIFQDKNKLISTSKGKLYIEKEFYNTTSKLLEFINKNSKSTDKILILPEGMMINFLSSTKTDDFYNSLLPLYEETFGSETIIKHYQNNMPNYIIFTSWNSKDYYFSMICDDYMKPFCEFVKKEYFLETRLNGDFTYVIYKHK